MRAYDAFGPLLCLMGLCSTYSHGTLILYRRVLISDMDVSCWINENLSMRKQIQPSKSQKEGFTWHNNQSCTASVIFWPMEQGVSTHSATHTGSWNRWGRVMDATAAWTNSPLQEEPKLQLFMATDHLFSSHFKLFQDWAWYVNIIVPLFSLYMWIWKSPGNF